MPWAFRGHQLFLIPRAFPELNAYYSPEDGAIFFGYLPLDGGGELQTCLSHDVVAHETTHAVLDGLRPRFAEPGLPDQPAFHEALADIVALLSVFSLEEVVARLLGKPDAQGRLKPTRADRGRSSAHGAVRAGGGARHRDWRRARQRAPPLDRPRPLRRLEERPRLPRAPSARRGARRRRDEHAAEDVDGDGSQALISARGADAARVAEEGAKSAYHLLHMFVRGIDYMPPIELEFKDVVDSVHQGRRDRRPRRPARLPRRASTAAFADFGIVADPARIVDLSHGEQPQSTSG